jgi:hypothetical protein
MIYKRLNNLESKISRKNQPQARVIFVDSASGETREQAQSRYEIEHSLKPMNPSSYIFINVLSDEQIRERNKKNLEF